MPFSLVREIIIFLFLEYPLLRCKLSEGFELVNLEGAFCGDEHLDHLLTQRFLQYGVGVQGF